MKFSSIAVCLTPIIVEETPDIVNPKSMEDDDSLDLMTDVGGDYSEKADTLAKAADTQSAAVTAAATKSLHMVCTIM